MTRLNSLPPSGADGEVLATPQTRVNTETTGKFADPALLAALAGLDTTRNRAVTNRTRRAVHQAAADMREGRQLERRDLGIALLTLVGVLLLLTPAIWNSIDELLGGEFLLDMPGIVAVLVFTLFGGVAAVLFLLSGQDSQGGRGLRHSRR